MSKGKFDIKSILDISRWEAVQDQLAKETGTAIITIDYKGTPLTKHSMRTEFCSIIRENPITRKRCQRCDSLAGLEAVRLNQPFIYLCHCGIVDVAVPVTVGDQYLGAVMFGQVRVSNGSDAGVERLVNEISSFRADDEVSALQPDLRELYQRLPEMEYERIVEIADLIDSIVKYTVNRAVKARNRDETYKWLMSTNSEQLVGEAEIQELSLPMSAREPERAETMPVKPSSVIYPAIAYINDHLRDGISMKEMADLCHLSPSYFSRTFNKETGESFVNYINRRKVALAKELLRETNKSITQIAEEAGYINISSFIAVFKRMEGVTPSVYRQHMYK